MRRVRLRVQERWNLEPEFFVEPNPETIDPDSNFVRLNCPMIVYLHPKDGYARAKPRKLPAVWSPSSFWGDPAPPFLCLAPRATDWENPLANGWQNAGAGIRLIVERVRDVLRRRLGRAFNRRRQPLFLTGVSLGGGGAWKLATSPPAGIVWRGVCLVCPKDTTWADRPAPLVAQAGRIRPDVLIYHDTRDATAVLAETTRHLAVALSRRQGHQDEVWLLYDAGMEEPDIRRYTDIARSASHDRDLGKNHHRAWLVGYSRSISKAPDFYEWMLRRI